MSNPEAILQLSRLLGRSTFRSTLGLQDGDEPLTLDENQRIRLRALIDARRNELIAALLEEAMASDDVSNATTANAYLHDRLVFLDDLLTPEQQERVRRGFAERVEAWSSPDTHR